MADDVVADGIASGAPPMTASFHGVRGSTPCHGPDIMRYGGNTSCVAIRIPGADPILLDLGTGLRYFGLEQPPGVPFRGTCLLSHLHWDHIQGLPFFTPLLTDGAEVTIHAPSQDDGTSVERVFARTITPPLFPIDLAMLPGNVSYSEVGDSEFVIDGGAAGDIRVMSRVIPHIGRTVGYRIEWNGRSIAYLSDHQQPCDGTLAASRGAFDLCRDVDLLIHDAQYTPAEFATKCDWGHCTVGFAVWLAAEAGAKRLALFHHDPTHDDETLDRLVVEARVDGEARGVDVVGASEGLTLTVGE
ncbi:MAG: MBL fold metallo-hydrolase [Ilumatobacter sp.]|uniref:MBL fold metallo-hydrolase n=1 Tax=Ilumatobacter sp. TaxID=1967498 RepID=UPI003297A9C5